MQRQTAVTAYLKSKQLLLFAFACSDCTYRWRFDLRLRQWRPHNVRIRQMGAAHRSVNRIICPFIFLLDGILRSLRTLLHIWSLVLCHLPARSHALMKILNMAMLPAPASLWTLWMWNCNTKIPAKGNRFFWYVSSPHSANTWQFRIRTKLSYGIIFHFVG